MNDSNQESLASSSSLDALVENLDLSDEVLDAIVGASSFKEAAIRLESQGHYPEAVLLLARGMIARTRVAWIAKCIREDESSNDVEILDQVGEWLQSEANEKNPELYHLALDRKHHTPAAWLALTAYWSGPSVAPPDSPDVPPPPHLPAIGAQGAIALCAVQGDPREVESRFRKFLALGYELVSETKSQAE